MKHIDIKFLNIGSLLAATIILGLAAGCGQGEQDHNDDDGKTNSPADGGDY